MFARRTLICSLAVGAALAGVLVLHGRDQGAAVPRPDGGSAAESTETRAATPPYVGANASRKGSHDPAAEWDKAQRDLGGGKLTYRRAFDPTIPAPGKEAWRDVKAPAHFYSVKPPDHDYKGFIAGKYDDRLRAVVKDLPPGTKFTMYHEPEDNMSGQDFYKLFKRLRDIVKAERPTGVQVWYVAMAYQWETNSKGNTGTNAGWIDAAKIADGVGLDVYASGKGFVTIKDDKGYQRWKKLVADPSGRPWGIIERGVSPEKGAAARTKILQEDWKYATANGASFFLYWQSDNGNGTDWRLKDPKEYEYYRSMAAAGRPIG